MQQARLTRIMARIVMVAMLALASWAPPVAADEIGDLQQQLAQLYGQGKYAEAASKGQKALAIAERTLGREHPQTVGIVTNLAVVLEALGRYTESEPLHQRALAYREKLLGKDHPDTLNVVSNLVALYNAQGRYAEAEPLAKRVLAGREKLLGKDHPSTLLGVNNLGELYANMGRYAEAEQLHKRALEGTERVLGKEHATTLTSVNNLAMVYQVQGRDAEAEALLKRALASYERTLGKDHPDTLMCVQNLAAVQDTQGRYAEAEALYARALAGRERVLGKEHPLTLLTANNLAVLYFFQKRYAEAEPLYKRVLAATEKLLGKDHPQTLVNVSNLALLYDMQDRYAEAEPLMKRFLDTSERVLGKDHPTTLTALQNMGGHYFSLGNWTRAVEYWQRATTSLANRTERGAWDSRQVMAGKKSDEAGHSGTYFSLHVKAAYRLAPEGRSPDAALSGEMFKAAQWVRGSEAAQSLSQMAARGATGDPRLAALVRERQDLAAEWFKRDGLRNATLAAPPESRDAKAEATNNARLAAIDTQIAAIDKRLAVEFPDFNALTSPAPLAVQEVRALLGADEALVLFLDNKEFKPVPEETFVWVVTKTDIRWVRSELGTTALTREVQALRCGLDGAAWMGTSCDSLSGQDFTKADAGKGKPLPFDHARAHALYKSLFGQVEDLIKGKHLLIVPSGALTQLPFQVLVKAPPANGDHKSAAWLIRSNALSILPAVTSLKALRRVARASAATQPMIGFGNPLLDGPDNRYGQLAQLAREKQQCRATPVQQMAALVGPRRGVTQIETRGGMARVAHIRMQVPLPETSDELCAVATDLKADLGEIHLGARATEREIKALNASGQLARYRIVHFATHGAMAGDLKGTSEPGLILTPPATATQADDGYLSASEVATLKLDADWVVLSACNTAAGDTTGAQALSGLAQAFFYAQARALLVSHWAVNSDAAVKLITGAMHETTRDATVGRAEALRRAMLALIDKGKQEEAHPAYWAPFVVVGEGAR